MAGEVEHPPLFEERKDRPVRLASIVAIDVVGFSTMSERDQRATAGKIEALRKRIGAVAENNSGRIFNTAGDGFMLEFGSAGSAVQAISALLDKKPKGEPAIRIGAHVGDVVVTINNDLLGHGVNVAARLQSLALPNSALVSGEFRSMARTSPSAAFKSKGRQPLENINQKVATFAIISAKQKMMRNVGRVFWGVAAAGAVAAAVVFGPSGYEYAKVHNLIPQQIVTAMGGPAPAPAASATPTVLDAAPAPAVAAAAAAAKAAAAQPDPSVATPTPEARPPQAGQTLKKDCDACPELIVLPAGSFKMGSPATEVGRAANEGPQHNVAVPAIAMGKYEVTFAEWDACLADGGCNDFSPMDKSWGRGRRPVIGVSWADAQSYVDWLNRKAGRPLYRLPTEAEWEYAARAGETKTYGASDTIARAQANFGSGRSDPVGSYTANAFGLFDMAGNVSEWTADCYRTSYAGAPADGTGVDDAACKQRVYRGGGYADAAPALRSAARRRADPTLRDGGIGFRVVRGLS